MKVKCENIYCVYNQERRCQGRAIYLDTSGSCLECITVEIPKQILEESKRQKRKELYARLKPQ